VACEGRTYPVRPSSYTESVVTVALCGVACRTFSHPSFPRKRGAGIHTWHQRWTGAVAVRFAVAIDPDSVLFLSAWAFPVEVLILEGCGVIRGLYVDKEGRVPLQGIRQLFLYPLGEVVAPLYGPEAGH
jgi:hypothetical protein